MKRRKYEKNSIYQDRVDYTLWNTICKEILTEKISLVQELKMSNDDKLLKLGKMLFNLNELPNHFRSIYYYNVVATGYDCILFETIFNKQS